MGLKINGDTCQIEKGFSTITETLNKKALTLLEDETNFKQQDLHNVQYNENFLEVPRYIEFDKIFKNFPSGGQQNYIIENDDMVIVFGSEETDQIIFQDIYFKKENVTIPQVISKDFIYTSTDYHSDGIVYFTLQKNYNNMLEMDVEFEAKLDGGPGVPADTSTGQSSIVRWNGVVTKNSSVPESVEIIGNTLINNDITVKGSSTFKSSITAESSLTVRGALIVEEV